MRIYGLLWLGLLCALPAVAGEVYIPFVAADAPFTDSGRSTTPTVDLYNLGAASRRYSVLFTPAGEDGTRVRELVGASLLTPGNSTGESCCARESGLLVVTGAPQIAVSARLGLIYEGPLATNLLTRLPALTARDGLRAGSAGVLVGLQGERSDAARSSLGILNLERSPATCSVSIGILDERFPELVEFVVPPLSVAAFPDIFARLRGVHAPASFETRTRATCNRLFYPFGINFVGYLQQVGDTVQVGVRWLEFVTPSVPIASAP